LTRSATENSGLFGHVSASVFAPAARRSDRLPTRRCHHFGYATLGVAVAADCLFITLVYSDTCGSGSVDRTGRRATIELVKAHAIQGFGGHIPKSRHHSGLGGNTLSERRSIVRLVSSRSRMSGGVEFVKLLPNNDFSDCVDTMEHLQSGGSQNRHMACILSMHAAALHSSATACTGGAPA
jgi:hypothetical protein